jgi:basic membrane protein A and related proteins
MKKTVCVAVLLLGLLGGSLAIQAQEALKIAFIFIGPVGDFGWSYMHNQGRLAIEEAFGNDVETEIVENVNSENTELVLNELINSGYTVIFTTSLDHQEALLKVAAENPEIQFISGAGNIGADNVAIINGRMYQPRYLSGMVAGSMTETNLVGFVAAHPFPVVISEINAFALGVRAVNPDALVQVVFTNTWFDPVIEAGAADSLLLSGADVIAQHQDTPEPQNAAARIGAYSISYNSDMSEIGETVLTGPIWNWGAKYVDIIQHILDGDYEANEVYWGGMEDGIVDLAPFSALVPEEVVEQVEERRAMIESGEWDIFCGPIYGENDGETVSIVEEGNCLSDEEITSQLYFVEGIIGDSAPESAPEGLGEAMETSD